MVVLQPIALMSMQREGEEEYNNFSKISWDITKDYGQIFSEL